jgi:hypothetical protein
VVPTIFSSQPKTSRDFPSLPSPPFASLSIPIPPPVQLFQQ